MASELWELGAIAEYIPVGIGIKDDVQALVDGTAKAFGKLDVTGTNASFTGSTSQLATQTLEAYNTVFDTSVRGLLFCFKHELRVMTEQRSGSIVNLPSTFGERGGAGAAFYSASKHAVNDPAGVSGKRRGTARGSATAKERSRVGADDTRPHPPMRCKDRARGA